MKRTFLAGLCDDGSNLSDLDGVHFNAPEAWSDAESDDDLNIDLEIVAFVQGSGDPWGERVDLYDSGATRHMSPYRDKFVSLTEIPPQTHKCGKSTAFSRHRCRRHGR